MLFYLTILVDLPETTLVNQIDDTRSAYRNEYNDDEDENNNTDSADGSEEDDDPPTPPTNPNNNVANLLGID